MRQTRSWSTTRELRLSWFASLAWLCACGSDATSPDTGSVGTGRAGTLAAVSGGAPGSTGGLGSAAISGRGGAIVAGAGTGTAGARSPAGTGTGQFSFFVTSWAAIQRLSGGPNGFGGDLRYGEADGLAGADKICREIAEGAVPGAGSKVWRAFLSVTKGPNGQPIHAIDRVGNGPWYDRLGRVVALSREALAMSRPMGADPLILNDLPNEDGVPNHAPDGAMQVDNHDVLTGSNETGQLYNADWKYTCHDWTSTIGSDGTPRVGHSWPRMGGFGRGGMPGTGAGGRGFPAAGRGAPAPPTAGRDGGGRPGGSAGSGAPAPPTAGRGGGGPGGDMANWMSALNEAGCAAGASLIEMGPPDSDNPTVGSGGGYGGIYCFSLTP